jgi:hypothetical protein
MTFFVHYAAAKNVCEFLASNVFQLLATNSTVTEFITIHKSLGGTSF